jgi:hypothetical protein
MGNSQASYLILGIGLLLLWGILWLTSPTPVSRAPDQTLAVVDPAKPLVAPPANSPESETAHVTNLALKLKGMLESGASKEEIQSNFQELKASVHVAEPSQAARHLIYLLRTGEDASTNMDFEVGEEGVLASAGSWRCMLLDLLGQTDPEQSAQFSQELLEETPSQEEYALCLRNLGWANFEGHLDHTLQEGIRSMLTRDQWLQDPQPPLLEALDAATATMMSKEMVELIQSPSTPYLLQRGAFVALDRMMLSAPLELGSRILQESEIFDRSPLQRASLLSRLEPSDPPQAALLQAYLQENLSNEELEYFFSIFPHTSTLDSHRLITGWDHNTSLADTESRIKASLQLAQQWRNNPQFSSIAKHLEKLAERLDNIYP